MKSIISWILAIICIIVIYVFLLSLGKSTCGFEYKDTSTMLIGLCTVIVALINSTFVIRQTKLNEGRNELEHFQNQPIFEVETTTKEDEIGDGKYGSEVLTIRKVSGSIRALSKIETTVYFSLEKTGYCERKKAVVKIFDYFVYSSTNGISSDILKKSFLEGNYRRYSDIYMESVYDRAEELVYYRLEKSIVTKISYKDIYNDDKIQYFISGNLCEKEAVEEIEKLAVNEYGISSVSYNDLKALLK